MIYAAHYQWVWAIMYDKQDINEFLSLKKCDLGVLKIF